MAAKKKPRTVFTVQLMRLEDLKPDPDNARDHDPEELARAFRRFGFNDPIEVDKADGMIAAGHGRLETLKIMMESSEKPPRNVLMDEDGMWLVPVVSGLKSKNALEAKAYRVSNNKQGEHGRWKDAELANVLQSTKAQGTLEGTGFTDRDLRSLTAKLNPPTPPEFPTVPPVEGDADYKCPKCGHAWKGQPK